MCAEEPSEGSEYKELIEAIAKNPSNCQLHAAWVEGEKFYLPESWRDALNTIPVPKLPFHHFVKTIIQDLIVQQDKSVDQLEILWKTFQSLEKQKLQSLQSAIPVENDALLIQKNKQEREAAYSNFFQKVQPR